VELWLGSIPPLVQLEVLLAGRIDAAFLNGMPSDESLLESLEAETESMQLALPTAQRLNGVAELRLRDLRDEPLMLISREYNPKLYDELRANFKGAGFTSRVVQEVYGFTASMLNLVAAGMGLAIVHSATRSRLPAGVVLRPVVDLTVPRRLDLAWRRDNRSPTLAEFVKTVQKQRPRGD
jgi:DNA-binding transcriptional LysR family regulator